jgi:arylsulfatase A-like enzyme
MRKRPVNPPAPDAPARNVLLITADQMRFDAIAAHGNPVIRTPNLDRLVARGTTFERAYTESPVCVPARAAILTGLLPHEGGVFDNGTPLADGEPTFVRDLAAAGHHTQAIGKMHFTPRRASHGFDELWLSEEVPDSPDTDEFLADLLAAGVQHVLEPHGLRHELYYSPQPSQLPAELHTTTWTGRRTAEYLRARAADARPFACWTSFIKPHPPFDPPMPYALMYDPLDMPDPIRSGAPGEGTEYAAALQHRVKWTRPDLDLDRVRTMRAYYYACVTHVDEEIGRILDALDETGLAESTLVVFTADHGEYLGDHGCFGKRGYHDPAARIPMILAGPGVPEGVEVDALVGLTDLAPTFRAAAGIDSAAPGSGRDLRAVAVDGAGRELLVGQYNERERGLYFATDGRHKYIYSAPDRREWLLEIGTDETVDLAGIPESAGILAALRAALIERFRRDGYLDPLDGEGWREYPVPPSFPLPGSGDRDPTARGRQYPTWRDNPAVGRRVGEGFYA